MTLQLPFGPDDEVFLMHENKVVRDIVEEVITTTFADGMYRTPRTRIVVKLKKHGNRTVGEFYPGQTIEKPSIFTTKEDLLASL